MARRFSPLLRSAFLLLLGLGLGSGCVWLAPHDRAAPQTATVTARTTDLGSLPEPAEKIVAAVYRFRDQTGQYKPTNGGSSFSTAVTQGATSILIQALDESGWFVPIEREGLSNLLNERQIIQTTRAQRSADGQGAPLPPLLFAGILIEGGIIGYDTNVLTGGLGARYLGMGASGQYRQDQVTVYLRAVSTQSGRVLKTVHATKTILSQQVDANVFRFVDTNRILETEAGYTVNEPKLIAVREAIEESVIALVVEGLRENLWGLSNPGDIIDPAIKAYDARKGAAADRDAFGRPVEPLRDPVAVAVSGGVQRANSDYANPEVRPSLALEGRFALTPRIALGLGAAGGGLAARDAFDRTHVTGEAFVQYTPLPRRLVTPYLAAGAGVLAAFGGETVPGAESNTLAPTLSARLGLEARLTPSTGLTLALGYTYTFSDELDAIASGTRNDDVWSLRTGFTYHLAGF